MRETKFRQAIFDDNGKFEKWHYWGFIDNAFAGVASGISKGGLSLEDAKEHSQEYIGLHDKNEKNEIWEGDLVRCPMGQVVPIKYIFNSFVPDGSHLEFHLKPILGDAWWKVVVVIGNIHENPELLK